MSKGLPRGGGAGGMMRQVQMLQEKLAAEQEALADERVEVTVGGGAVRLTMTGRQQLLAVEIQPQLLAPEEHDMLAELLVAAVNQAIEKSQALAAERMGALTRGLPLPPGLGF